MRRMMVAAMLVSTGAFLPASASCERACKIDAANEYLAALVSHDGSNVPFAPDAWRQENGGAKLQGGEAIRDALGSPIMYVITGMHDLRWYVEGDEVIAIYDLDTVAPTFIFERFTVRDDGLIYEIDAHFYIDIFGHAVGPDSAASNPDERRKALLEANHGPLGPVPVQEGNTGDDAARAPSLCSRTCVAAAVEAFLDAMISHDPSDVPLAAGATQTINHRPIADIEANLADTANGIVNVANRLLSVDGDQAVALYEIVLSGGSRLYGAARFEVVDGSITNIEAVCSGAEFCAA